MVLTYCEDANVQVRKLMNYGRVQKRIGGECVRVQVEQHTCSKGVQRRYVHPMVRSVITRHRASHPTKRDHVVQADECAPHFGRSEVLGGVSVMCWSVRDADGQGVRLWQEGSVEWMANTKRITTQVLPPPRRAVFSMKQCPASHRDASVRVELGFRLLEGVIYMTIFFIWLLGLKDQLYKLENFGWCRDRP